MTLCPTNPAVLRAKCAAYELFAGQDIDSIAWRTLKEWGVDYDAMLNRVGPVCTATVTFLEDGRFAYDDLGETAFLFVVTDENGEHESDIVAWPARFPETFGTLLGQAAVIGADQLVNPATYYKDISCPLWRTPLSWLQNRCEGAVVINPIPAALITARAPKLAAEDLEHARELVHFGAVRPDQLVVPTNSIGMAA